MTGSPDIEVSTFGSITTMTGLSEHGESWLKNNVHAEAWQWNGPSIVVDVRYAGDIIEGAKRAGLTVE